jgi:aspartyl protease family protein
MKNLVVMVVVIGALVGWFAPGLRAPEAEVAPPAAAEEPEAQLALAAKPVWHGGQVVLDRERDGHFYAPVRVDTRDYRMLVDTGASMVALTGEDARNIGLDWDPNRLAPVARTANGVVMGVRVELPEVAVGDFVARGVDAVIIPEGLPISLLGQSFLANVQHVAISGDTLTLSN